MTTNEMIYKTITTKLTKTPVYKSVLEDLGYEVIDREWSSYNNWTIKNKATGNMVMFSKDYDNKRGLFDGPNRIKTNDFKKVDYVDLLNKHKRDSFNNNETKYAKLRRTITSYKWYIDLYKKRIKEKQKEIEKLNNELEEYILRLNHKENELDNTRKEIIELKNK